MNRFFKFCTPGYADYGAVIEKCRIERGQGVSLRVGEATEEAAEAARVLAPECREALKAFRACGGEAFIVPTIDEHESRAPLARSACRLEGLGRSGGGAESIAGLEFEAGDGRKVRVPPFLELRGGEALGFEKSERLVPQPNEPRGIVLDPLADQGRALFSQPLVVHGALAPADGSIHP